MQFTVSKKDFQRALARMQGVAAKKSTMPALSTVLLRAEGHALRLSATDLYLAIETSVAAEVATPGGLALPAKDLLERVKAMPDGSITVTEKDGAATLKASGSARRYSLRGMPAEDFPKIPVPATDAPAVSLGAKVLLDLVGLTSFSVSTDESRAHLNSALFEWDGDTVRMVSTDGHRLTKAEVKVAGRRASSTMLLPLKAIQELGRFCEEAFGASAEAEVRITQSGPCAHFEVADVRFSTKLVDATFPPYAQVIPKSVDKTAKMSRAVLVSALRAVALAAQERTGGVSFVFSKTKLTVTAKSHDGGDADDEVPIEYDGADLAIGFSAKYVLDVLGALDEEEVIFQISQNLDPAVIVPVGDRSFLAVVMPLRI